MEYRVKYPAILKKEYEDGTYGYETWFENEMDFYDRLDYYFRCLVKREAIDSSNNKSIVSVSIIRGLKKINKELDCVNYLN